MTEPKAIAAAFAPELPSMLAMIERVVSIDSGSYHAPGVNAVIDVFAAFLDPGCGPCGAGCVGAGAGQGARCAAVLGLGG